jgi:hypothetical protein
MKTSVTDCVLLYWFHHQVVIHRWGWTLVLNPDGTTTAWNKDKSICSCATFADQPRSTGVPAEVTSQVPQCRHAATRPTQDRALA